MQKRFTKKMDFTNNFDGVRLRWRNIEEPESSQL